jgi:hypothetical protein
MSYLESNNPKAGCPLGRSLLPSPGGLSECLLPFHYHSHPTHVRFTAVLGTNMLQHCLRGQRAWVSDACVKVLDVLRVCASTTDKNRTGVISADAVHNKKSTESFPVSNVIRITLRLPVRSR